jgi:hypothetical protein
MPDIGLKLPRFRSTTTAMMAEGCSQLRLAAKAVLLLVLLPSGAVAQAPPSASLQSQSQSAPQLPPATAKPVPPVFTLTAPRGGNAAPTGSAPLQLAPTNQPLPPQAAVQQAMPHLRAGEIALMASARFGRDLPITGGLTWRVYADKPDNTGMHRLLKEEKSASPAFALPAGGYIVHVAFGLASTVKTVQLRDETVREVFEMPAGGLRLEGRVGDVKIASGHISFEIYKGSQFESGDKKPIVTNMMTGDVVLLPEGTYFIVSKYGDGNALVRSDIRVQAGKLTDVLVTHRAAVIMLKLVSRKDGEALANTEWAVVSPAGDVITETKGAFPRVILAEGEYRIIARNENRTYPQDIKVITGVDREIEVLAK